MEQPSETEQNIELAPLTTENQISNISIKTIPPSEIVPLEIIPSIKSEEVGKETEAESIYEVHYTDNDDLQQIAEKIGIIFTSFPENYQPNFEGCTNFPPSYYTLTSKERLMLLYAENFRRQMNLIFPNRRPPILAVKNECRVQKFVCTTIRPSSFLYPKLIGSWQENAKFVADFITYEPLINQLAMPNRLISPDTLLSRRTGNSFEMATLLCSLLIGNGFSAFVVSGYATREVVNNDKRRVDCPFIPTSVFQCENEDVEREEEPTKYSLRDPPFLDSRFHQEVKRREQQKLLDKAARMEEKRQEELRELEKLPPDPNVYRRYHSWVAIMKHAPWSYKPDERKEMREAENDGSIQPTVFFIEPSTGFRFEATDKNYIAIESIWNNYNYYVNCQEPITDIGNMRWDLKETSDWEHLLTGEPYELRIEQPLGDDVDNISPDDDTLAEKHLDVPASWVRDLKVAHTDYDQRYPGGEKIIHYKRAIIERYSPYKNEDGLMTRLTIFEDLEYETSMLRWEWFENRKDLLHLLAFDYKTKQVDEYFSKGRADFIKHYRHNAETLQEKLFEFYHVPRLDALISIKVHPLYIHESYSKRNDFLYYREFTIKPRKLDSLEPKSLTKIIEKFHRNDAKNATDDIAERIFNISENKIFLQFHYAEDSITANTRTFTKPPKPDYECEIVYNPEDITSYIANPVEVDVTEIKKYYMLLAQLEAEEKCMKAFHNRCSEIEKMLYTHKFNMKNACLTFNVFDPLRNCAARTIRMEKDREAQERQQIMFSTDADFLAPYLVPYKDLPLSRSDSQDVFNKCVNGLKNFYLSMLNELQRQYDLSVVDGKHFRRFLNKFQEKFDDYEYDHLIKEGEGIEMNRRMIQQRLINTNHASTDKIQLLVDRLMNDPRLRL